MTTVYLQAIDDRAHWATWVEKYHRRLTLEANILPREERWNLMSGSNPSFILRNWIAQEAIKDAEKGQFNTVRSVNEHNVRRNMSACFHYLLHLTVGWNYTRYAEKAVRAET